MQLRAGLRAVSRMASGAHDGLRSQPCSRLRGASTGPSAAERLLKARPVERAVQPLEHGLRGPVVAVGGLGGGVGVPGGGLARCGELHQAKRCVCTNVRLGGEPGPSEAPPAAAAPLLPLSSPMLGTPAQRWPGREQNGGYRVSRTHNGSSPQLHSTHDSVSAVAAPLRSANMPGPGCPQLPAAGGQRCRCTDAATARPSDGRTAATDRHQQSFLQECSAMGSMGAAGAAPSLPAHLCAGSQVTEAARGHRKPGLEKVGGAGPRVRPVTGAL